MDVFSEKTRASGVTGPLDMIVAYGHTMKLHRINSKDKLNNVFLSSNVDHEKKRTCSRLPRVVKTPSQSNNSFHTCNHNGNTGDSTVGTSKPKFSWRNVKSKIPPPSNEFEKSKSRSFIPRRKIMSPSVGKDCDKKLPNNNYFSKKSQHIQRVHLPNITPDFQQEDHSPSTSVGRTKPIPTLGQIYRRNNIIIDEDRFYDWFMELDTPVNSLDSTRQQRRAVSSDSGGTAQTVIGVEVQKPHCFSNSERSKVVFGANTANVFKTTNDNVSDWLTSELDYSGKDNESGYRSMSPQSRGPITIESKHSDAAVKQSDENYCLTLEKTSESSEAEKEDGEEPEIKTADTDILLTEQPTVVISKLKEENEEKPTRNEHDVKKIDIALAPIVICKSGTGFVERSKNLQFPSITGTQSCDEKQALAPSYVECPSEILQRTTNFEGDGFESPKTLSSIGATDLEIRDDYSSLYTLENEDDSNLEDHQSVCPGCRSQSCMTFTKSGETDITNQQTSCIECGGDRSKGTIGIGSEPIDHFHRNCRTCGRRTLPTHLRDSRMYCKKNSRYRRFPSYRYELPIPFDSLRKKFSIRKLCKHRWNRVWKKTATRWRHWSKPYSKLGKFRMLEYLQSSVLWEDVDVQTQLLLYRETGTYTNVMERKSAGITASLTRDNSTKKNEGATSTKSLKSRIKQINLGPSRFPFFYHSKRKSMPLQKVEEAPKPVQRFFSCTENQNKEIDTVDFKRPSEVMNTKETSMICGFFTTNADTSPINVHRKCPCQKKSEDNESKKLSERKSICPMQCPPASNDSLNKIHKLKTANTETDELIYRFENREVANISLSTNVEVTRTRDECTQMILVSNNMEIDARILPKVSNNSVETEIDNIHFYKPFGINTDLHKVEILNEVIEHKAAEMMTSETKTECPGPSNVLKDEELLETPKLGDTSDNSTTSDIAKSAGILENNGKNGEEKSDEIKDRLNTNELATETSTPHLTSTEAKIVSISSAHMLPVSVLTSQCDVSPFVHAQPVQVNVSTTTTSMICRCKECRVAASGRSYVQVNKSTDIAVPSIEDKNIGPGSDNNRVNFERSTSTVINSTDTNTTDGTTTYMLIDQWNRSEDLVDTGTAPQNPGNLSTCACVSVDQRSAFAATSKKKMQSFNMVTSNGNDFFTLKRVTASTNTSHSSKRSIGLPSLTTRDAAKSTIDTWVQYSHVVDQNDKQSLRLARIGQSKLIAARTLNDSMVYGTGTSIDPIIKPPSYYKSTAIMTSGPFDEASDTAEIDVGRKDLACACAQCVGRDMETNTQSDFQTKRHTEISTQIFQSQCNPNMDKATCSSEDYAPTHTCTLNDNSVNRQNTADQLASLSRLIGQVKSSARTTPTSAEAITSAILSSNLDAAKWIKRCTNNEEKDYPSLIDIEQSTLETLKQASISIENSNKSSKLPTKTSLRDESKIRTDVLCTANSIAIASQSPITTVSVDSLADVFPVKSTKKSLPPSTFIKKMADKVTSAEVITKSLKESILQTCPDIRNAETDAIHPNTDCMKSVSAFTSRCVLPSPSDCCPDNSVDPVGCIFIYDKPRCAVHKKRMDASVQMTQKDQEDKDIEKKLKCCEKLQEQLRSVGTPPNPIPSNDRKNRNSNVIGEVLPPKAYKALYETTKMAVKDSLIHPLSNSVNCGPDLENEAAFIRALAIRSAALLTSGSGLSPSEKNRSFEERAEYVYGFNSPSPHDSTQTCANCHARLLDLAPYFQTAGEVEERVKTQLVDSCRYYSNLLTKRLERVKEKVTKHLAPPRQQCLYFSTMPKLSYTEALTMKPSGREDLGCQTGRSHLRKHALPRPISCCTLTPSLTNICGGNEKQHLKSVYYMLSAIEGRIRRLKRNIPNE